MPHMHGASAIHGMILLVLLIYNGDKRLHFGDCRSNFIHHHAVAPTAQLEAPESTA